MHFDIVYAAKRKTELSLKSYNTKIQYNKFNSSLIHIKNLLEMLCAIPIAIRLMFGCGSKRERAYYTIH